GTCRCPGRAEERRSSGSVRRQGLTRLRAFSGRPTLFCIPATAGILLCPRHWLFMFRVLLPLLLSGACSLLQAAPHIAPDRLQTLAGEPLWLSLGHYERGTLGVWHSYVDDYEYFLAEHGEKDPLAELKATVPALIRDPALGNRHPQCIYTARTRWLHHQMSP